MKKITCATIMDLLPLYIDDICADETKLIVENHLKTCMQCQMAYEEMAGGFPAHLGVKEKVMDAKSVDKEQEVPFMESVMEEQNQKDQKIIKDLAHTWKKGKRKSWIAGMGGMLIVVAVFLGIFLYARSPRAVRTDEVQIENVSELPNGHVFFQVDVADDIHATGVNWYENQGVIYVSLQTQKEQWWNKKQVTTDFSESSEDFSSWEFNTKYTGVKEIYYTECFEEGYDGSKKKLIWSKDTELKPATQETLTWTQSYSAWGNVEPGLLAKNLYQAKNPYVGDISANGKILTELKIAHVLGNFKNALQTKQEPYGYTLEFEEQVTKAQQEWFDEMMTNYAYCMLALIDNLSEVHFTYTLQEGAKTTQVTNTVTTKDATKALGEKIKDFSNSTADVQRLLYLTGIETAR